MKLSRFFLTVFILTATFCVYIQLQMQIVDLAYQGKKKENILERLKDTNGNVNSDILKLKSSQSLGVKLLSANSPWQFVDEKQVAELNAPEEFVSRHQAIKMANAPDEQNIFSRIFSLKSSAEAGLR